MKYALQTNIEFSATANKKFLAEGLKDKLAGKRLWEDERNPNMIADYFTETGNPALSIIQRFKDKDERDEVALFLEDLILRIPAISGEVKAHKCYHDQPELNRLCEPEN